VPRSLKRAGRELTSVVLSTANACVHSPSVHAAIILRQRQKSGLGQSIVPATKL
jgi:AhpD family alkylhydroperoxidase